MRYGAECAPKGGRKQPISRTNLTRKVLGCRRGTARHRVTSGRVIYHLLTIVPAPVSLCIKCEVLRVRLQRFPEFKPWSEGYLSCRGYKVCFKNAPFIFPVPSCVTYRSLFAFFRSGVASTWHEIIQWTNIFFLERPPHKVAVSSKVNWKIKLKSKGHVPQWPPQLATTLIFRVMNQKGYCIFIGLHRVQKKVLHSTLVINFAKC